MVDEEPVRKSVIDEELNPIRSSSSSLCIFSRSRSNASWWWSSSFTSLCRYCHNTSFRSHEHLFSFLSLFSHFASYVLFWSVLVPSSLQIDGDDTLVVGVLSAQDLWQWYWKPLLILPLLHRVVGLAAASAAASGVSSMVFSSALPTVPPVLVSPANGSLLTEIWGLLLLSEEDDWVLPVNQSVIGR